MHQNEHVGEPQVPRICQISALLNNMGTRGPRELKNLLLLRRKKINLEIHVGGTEPLRVDFTLMFSDFRSRQNSKNIYCKIRQCDGSLVVPKFAYTCAPGQMQGVSPIDMPPVDMWTHRVSF